MIEEVVLHRLQQSTRAHVHGAAAATSPEKEHHYRQQQPPSHQHQHHTSVGSAAEAGSRLAAAAQKGMAVVRVEEQRSEGSTTGHYQRGSLSLPATPHSDSKEDHTPKGGRLMVDIDEGGGVDVVSYSNRSSF